MRLSPKSVRVYVVLERALRRFTYSTTGVIATQYPLSISTRTVNAALVGLSTPRSKELRQARLLSGEDEGDRRSCTKHAPEQGQSIHD